MISLMILSSTHTNVVTKVGAGKSFHPMTKTMSKHNYYGVRFAALNVAFLTFSALAAGSAQADLQQNVRIFRPPKRKKRMHRAWHRPEPRIPHHHVFVPRPIRGEGRRNKGRPPHTSLHSDCVCWLAQPFNFLPQVEPGRLTEPLTGPSAVVDKGRQLLDSSASSGATLCAFYINNTNRLRSCSQLVYSSDCDPARFEIA